MPGCSSWSFGTYVANENAYVVWGRQTPVGARPVVSLQGSHSLAVSLKGDTTAERLGDGGYVVVCGDLSQTLTQGTFGNPTSVTRAGQLKTFIQGANSPLIAGAGKVHLIGASGGATAAINYARANPTLVASMYLVVPCVDTENYYTNYTNGGANGTGVVVGPTQAEIHKAFNGGVDDGGTAYLAAMPASNPARAGNQAALAGIPMTLAYSTTDPFFPVATITSYAAAVNAAGGSATAVSQGAVGHTADGINSDDVALFFNRNR